MHSSLKSGPEESREARLVLYVGEGTLLATLLYVLLAVLPLAFYPILPSGELFGAAVFMYLVTVTLLLRAVGFVVSATPRSEVNREWSRLRQWPLVGVTALPLLSILVGISWIAWGWDWPFSGTLVLGTGAFTVGFLLRSGIRLLLEEGPTDMHSSS